MASSSRRKATVSRLVSKCSIRNCDSVKVKNVVDSSGLTLHLFPAKREQQLKWLEVIDQEELKKLSPKTLQANTYICSNHFESSCYGTNGTLLPN